MSQQPIQHAIHRLFAHHDLTAAEADAAMTQIMEGEATPAQIALLENELRAALEEGLQHPEQLAASAGDRPGTSEWIRSEVPSILERLPDFRRQYVGVIDSTGAKHVLVRCFPGPRFPDSLDFDRWKEELVVVSDGGFWYWTILYDPESGRFSDFRSNGYA